MIVTVPIRQAGARLSDVVHDLALGDEIVLADGGRSLASIHDPDNRVYVSPASHWKIAIKALCAAGRVRDVLGRWLASAGLSHSADRRTAYHQSNEFAIRS
jgi:antitoxin (DNA-binding transcriptional repressor) of toxin-antitoxin stability system